LSVKEESLDLVVRLFDVSLSGAGRRFAGRPALVRQMSRLLDTMYRSELGLSRDRFAAKNLPVVYIGALGNPHGDERSERFFESFGYFIQLWDDWLDLTEDALALAPNVFLGAPQTAVSLESFRYTMRFLARAAGGPLFHAGLTTTLSAALARSLLDARYWDERAYRQTLTLCHEILL
jgi:hypothetical protein